ncbi:MAG: DoxX family protein [Rhodothermales bacterium]
MIWSKLSKYQDAGLLVLRLGFGLGFLFFHGWGKLTGGPERWEGLGAALSIFGINFGHTFFGFMAAFSESIGGIMLAAGLFYRPITALLACTMFVAMSRHFITGDGSAGHSFKNFFVLLGLITIGPGKYSIDAWLSRKKS